MLLINNTILMQSLAMNCSQCEKEMKAKFKRYRCLLLKFQTHLDRFQNDVCLFVRVYFCVVDLRCASSLAI